MDPECAISISVSDPVSDSYVRLLGGISALRHIKRQDTSGPSDLRCFYLSEYLAAIFTSPSRNFSLGSWGDSCDYPLPVLEKVVL